MLFTRDYPRVRVPVVGIWSSGDRFLVERQMRNSEQFCDAGWCYERLDGCNHWLQLSAHETLNPLLLKHLG
jgi:pimeloyl-ACP methyl ester carboxylesterase